MIRALEPCPMSKIVEVLVLHGKQANSKDSGCLELFPAEAKADLRSEKPTLTLTGLTKASKSRMSARFKNFLKENEIDSGSVFVQLGRIEGQDHCLSFELARERELWTRFETYKIPEPGEAFGHGLPEPFDRDPVSGNALVLVYLKAMGDGRFSVPSKGGPEALTEWLKKSCQTEAQKMALLDETSPLKRIQQEEDLRKGPIEPPPEPKARKRPPCKAKGTTKRSKTK